MCTTARNNRYHEFSLDTYYQFLPTSTYVDFIAAGKLIIRILEVNDQDPRFERSVYNLDVREELSVGSYVATVAARDADDKIQGYQIVEQSQRLFRINAKTGTTNPRLK